MTNAWPLISIVLPAYNEAGALPRVISAICEALTGVSVRSEILVVDDGSSDGTRDIMLNLCKKQPHVHYIRFSRNFGKEAALSAGLKSAAGDAVILMDADGQHPAKLLPLFIERWRSGAEIVAGVQHVRAEPYLKRSFKSWYYRLLRGSSLIVIPANAGDFRLMDRKAVDAINALPERSRFMKGLYAWIGFRTELVPFDAELRVAGETKFTWAELFSLAFTGLTSFTVVPLRLVALVGLFISFTSLVYGCYLLFEYLVGGNRLPGWPTLAVGMMFLSGVQLMALGVIAEYVGRTFQEVKQRPLYIVSEDTRSMRLYEDAPPDKAPVENEMAPEIRELQQVIMAAGDPGGQ